MKILQPKFATSESMFHLEVGKFMHHYTRNKLPKDFNEYFSPLSAKHTYHTRLRENKNYFLPRVKTKCSQKLISFIGTQIWAKVPKEIKGVNLVLHLLKFINLNYSNK